MRAYTPSTPLPAAAPVAKPKLGASGLPLRALAQLIQALETNAIRGASVSPELMIHDLDLLLASLDASRPEAEVLQCTSESVQSVAAYFSSIGASLSAIGLDMEAGIKAISGIASSLGNPQTAYSQQLDQIETRFRAARGLDDLAALRDQMQSCIAALQQETARVIAEQAAQKALITAQLEQLEKVAKRTQDVGDATGPVAAILRFKRLQVLADRYGPSIAKQIRDYVEQILRSRWAGEPKVRTYPPDCIVLIDTADEDVSVFKYMLRKLSAERLVFNAKVDDREVMVRVGLDWTVVRLRSEDELEEIVPTFLKKFSSNEAKESV